MDAQRVEEAACECCGLKEECTQEYMEKVKKRFYGRWLCGLCAEVVKDELCRGNGLGGLEEALVCHMRVCSQFHNANPAVNVAQGMRRMLRRGFESSKGLHAAHSSSSLGSSGDPSGPSLGRSASCLSTFAAR